MSARKRKAASPRVAVVGCGHWGKNLIRNFAELGALVGIHDEDRDHAETFLQKYPHLRVHDSFESVLADSAVDAVVVATPAATHSRVVRSALSAGKDVFVEKPLALSVDEGESLVRLAGREGRVLMVGHLLWYHPAVLELKRLIEQGELGRIRYVYSNRLNLGKIRREENILWSFAPHDISVILGLLGEMPSAVEARGGNYLHAGIADVTVSLLSFPSGVKAHIFVSWLHPFKEQKLVVVGEKKMAVFDDIAPRQKLTLYPHSIEWRAHLPVASRAEGEAVAVELEEPLRNECQHFLDCVASRQTPRTDGAEGLRVLSVLDRCEAALGSEPAASPADPSPAAYFVHPSAFIDEGATIGAGTKIWHVSHVMPGSRIGDGCSIGQNVVIGPRAVIGDRCKIQNNVSVYEGVELEDEVFCGPSMVFTNVVNPRSAVSRKHDFRTTRVGRGATLGANSTILCGLTIGRYAFVAAGAVVTRDVPDYALVVGSPARRRGWMCECGLKIEFDGADGACDCGKRYRRGAKDEVQPVEETPVETG